MNLLMSWSFDRFSKCFIEKLDVIENYAENIDFDELYI